MASEAVPPARSSMARPVPVAILGAGIFARDAYAPVLREVQAYLEPRIVWSRSQESAEKLAVRLREAGHVGVEALSGEEGLESIESSRQVQACVVILPIQAQPQIVLRLLSAGKHVLQEKPIAVSVPDAWSLIHWYEGTSPSVPSSTDGVAAPLPPVPRALWGVAENFRMEPVFDKAGEAVASLGRLLTASVTIEVAMLPSNKYYNSAWRRDAALVGAFITDCGVHYVAGLREMVRSRVTSVAAHCTHMRPALPPPDNLTASFSLASGCSGTLQVSFCAPLNKMLWRAVCEAGVVEVERGVMDGKFGYLMRVAKPGVAVEVSFFEFDGMATELRAFAGAVVAWGGEGGTVGSAGAAEGINEVEGEGKGAAVGVAGWDKLAPRQALEDLAVVTACLESDRNGHSQVVIPYSD